MASANIAGYLDASAARWARRPALVDGDGSVVTYESFAAQSAALARFLCDRGVRRGDRVALLVTKQAASLVAIFGVLKAGAAYVPVDTSAPADRIVGMLRHCEVRAVVVDADLVGLVPRDITRGLVAQIVIGAVADAAEHTSLADAIDAGQHSTAAPDSVAADDLAYIIHTSGSTGVPKGVAITHGNVRALIDWAVREFGVTAQDCVCSYSPLYFDPSVMDIFSAAASGASLHLVPETLARSPRPLREFLEERKITVWVSTPAALIMLLQFGGLDDQSSWRPRIVTFGGEVFPLKHLRELRRVLPSSRLINAYGPTEATVTCTFFQVPVVISDDRREPMPIGGPAGHCLALVIGADGQEVGAGGEGELLIGGPAVFPGYWRRPEETAASFVDRFGQRWYRTGDIVRLGPEGMLFIGRRDRMVKRRGFRIELGDIEHGLLAHADVQDVAVAARTDDSSTTRIIAFVVRRAGGLASMVDLKAHCGVVLSAYMNPDQIVFVDALPLTPTGKVSHAALLERLVTAGATAGVQA